MRNTRGFTIIEVLFAAVILAVALLGIAGMFPTAYGNVDRSGDQTAAVGLAQERIEWLRNQPLNSNALGDVTGDTTETLADEYAGYTRTTQITNGTPLAATPPDGTIQMMVTVTTPGGRSVQLVSLIAR